MRYAEFIREDQRLVMLRVLNDLPAYTSNSSVLYSALAQYGHAISRDQIKAEIWWLRELGLVNVQELETVLVVTLTERGADVAAGRTHVPGVKKPGA